MFSLLTKLFQFIFIPLLSIFLLVSCGGDGDGASTNNNDDTTSPVITLNGDNPVTILIGDTYVELGAVAIDDVDGALDITISGNVDTSTPNSYIITYNAVDSANNSSTVTRTVVVVDANAKVCPSETAPISFTSFSTYDARSLKAITVIPSPVGPDRIAGIDSAGLALLEPNGDLVLQQLDFVLFSNLTHITTGRIFIGQMQQVIVGNATGVNLYSATVPLNWRAEALTGAVIDLAVADVQGDGADELFVLTATGVLMVSDDGAGGLQINALPINLPADPTALAVGFIDSDAYADIVVISASEGAVHYGASDGTFPQSASLPALANYRALALVDVDHSNDLDLIISTDNDIKVLLGGTRTHTISATLVLTNVDRFSAIPSSQDSFVDIFAIGNMATGSDIMRLANNAGTLSIAEPLPTPGNTLTVLDAVAAEMSCDDQPEVVFVGASNSGAAQYTGIYRGQNGAFVAPTWVEAPSGITEDVVAGDFNGDGLDDIVAAHRDAGDTRLYLNLGNGVLAPGVSVHAANSPMDLVVARVNNDANLDIIIAEEGDAAITILLGDGNAGFTLSTLDLSAVGSARAIGLGDFDGDQIDDLFAADVNNAGHLFKGDGAGGFIYLTSVTNFASGSAQSLALADLNGDTYLDALIGGTVFNSEGYLYLIPGNGDGTYGVPVKLLSHRVTNIFPLHVNNDDAIDLVVDPGDFLPGIRIYSNDGQGSLISQTPLTGLSNSTDGFPGVIGLFDLDGNGLDDPVLTTSNSGPRSVGVFLNQGDLSFEPLFIWGGRSNGTTFGQLDDKPGLDFVTVTFSNSIMVFLQR